MVPTCGVKLCNLGEKRNESIIGEDLGDCLINVVVNSGGSVICSDLMDNWIGSSSSYIEMHTPSDSNEI